VIRGVIGEEGRAAVTEYMRRLSVYSRFTAALSGLTKKRREEHEDLSSFVVKVGNRFSATSACSEWYAENKLKLGSGGIEGQTMTLLQLFDTLTTTVCPRLGNSFFRGAVIWGLLDQASREAVSAYGVVM